MTNASLCTNISFILGSYKKYVSNTANANVDFFVSVLDNRNPETKCAEFEETAAFIKSKNFKLNRQDMKFLKEKGQSGFNMGVVAAISMAQFERQGFLSDFAHIGGVEIVKWLVQDSAQDFADLSKLYQIAFNHAPTSTK